MATKMSFEGKLYYGVKGSTAATEIGNVRDVNYNLEPDKGDTTTRGTGGTPPLKTSRVTAIGVTIEFTMLVKTGDATYEALRTAAAAGTAVALRMIDHSAGKGFDGDVNLSMRQGQPIAGEQTVQFTADPNDEDRAPQLYV